MAGLNIGKPAPDFTGTAVVNGKFKEINLSEYRGKYLILFFYSQDFEFVCPTEIIAFSDRVEEFRSINCEVVAASTNSHLSHLAWVNTPCKQGGLGNINIPLLADKTCTIARDYACLKEDESIAFRGLYIIDDQGNLRLYTIGDLPVGRSVDETLRLVQAFQFTDKHGKVCPADWKPGCDTIVPDPKESKIYFRKRERDRKSDGDTPNPKKRKKAEDPPMAKTVNPPMAKTVNQPMAKTDNPPMVKTTNPPMVKTVNQPMVKTENLPMVKTQYPPMVQTVNRPMAKTDNPPMVKAVNKPMVKTANPPKVKTVNTPMAKTQYISIPRESSNDPPMVIKTEYPIDLT